MAREVVMPRLGWGAETGTLVEWLKRDGETVQAGDIICTVAGDKANVEVETMDSGVLRIPPDSPQLGAEVPVGTLMAYVVAPGSPAPFEAMGATPAAAHVSEQTPRWPTAARAEAQVPATPLPLPKLGASGAAPPPARPPMANIAGMSTARAERLRQPPISPLARRLAHEQGVVWTALHGSGRTGRIVARDIRQATTQPATAPDRDRPPAASSTPVPRLAASERLAGPFPDVSTLGPASPPTAADGQWRVALSKARRVTAARIRQSVATVAPVTLTTEVDASALVQLREQFIADVAGTDHLAPSYNDLLIRLVALSLQDHPALNASLAGDELALHTAAHIGLAVDSEYGLLVPVVRDAQAKSIQQIALESARLVQQARSGTLAAGALGGGTFTITNLGPFGIDAFTPIINLPECAILGVGRIQARPVVIDEATEHVVVRKMLTLSLTFDHRIVDGAPAARFLQQIARYIERPTLWLVR